MLDALHWTEESLDRLVWHALIGPRAGVTPFAGQPHSIPGRIEAEHYDLGEPGRAYQDVDEANLGADYREPTQVDIERRDDASNGHGIGWTREGEWVVYTVHVSKAGPYTIRIPVASNGKGGTFHLELDARDVTGPIQVPDTGSWQQLKMIETVTIALEPGVYSMRAVMDANGASGSIADIDYFEFELTGR